MQILRDLGLLKTFVKSVKILTKNLTNHSVTVSRDRVFGTATGYGLDGSGIESLWERYFSPRPALVPTQPPVIWAPALFPGCKAASAWR